MVFASLLRTLTNDTELLILLIQYVFLEFSSPFIRGPKRWECAVQRKTVLTRTDCRITCGIRAAVSDEQRRHEG